MTPIKKTAGLIFVVVFVAVWLVLARGSRIEHVEDTNGAENYSLAVITDANIEKMDFGARGFSMTTDNLTNHDTYSSKKYSGVTEVIGETSIGSSYTVYVNYFDLYEGNAKLVLTRDDKIIHEFVPGEARQYFTAENAAGAYFSLRLAGESAKFKLDIN